MFHTRFDEHEKEAREFIEQVVLKIEELILLLNIPEEQRVDNWREKFNELTEEISKI